MYLIQSHFMAVCFAVVAGTLAGQQPSLPTGTTSADSASASANATLLSQAEDAIVRGDMQKALPLLNNVVAIEPNNAHALYDRGYVEQSLQQTDAAIADFQKAVAADPRQYAASAALGRLYAAQGKLADARKQLEAASALTPVDVNPNQSKARDLRLLARVDDDLHDPAAATNALIAALQISPEQPEDTLLTATLAEQQNDEADAETAYRKVLTEVPPADPKYSEAVNGLTRILIHTEKFSEAETLLRQALDQQPKNAALTAQLVTVLAAEGKTPEAISELESLHQANPNQAAVTSMLADLYTRAGEPAKADSLYVQLLAQGKPGPDLLTERGENLIQQQRCAEAVTVLQQAVQLRQDLPDTWSDLAFAASESHQYALVLRALDQRANYKPEGPATLFLRATAYDHLHQTKQAIVYYLQFLDSTKTEQQKFSDEIWQTQHRLVALKK